MTIALITVVHDPDGRSMPFLDMVNDRIDHIYSELYITVSNESSLELRNRLERYNFKIKIIPPRGVNHARRAVLDFGMKSECSYFHYCDFDRLLTWASLYPEELKKTVKAIIGRQYVIFGRTENAFSTHPSDWIETEKIANRIFSLEFGENVDITGGSCGFSRESGEYIERHSKDRWTDAEWPMIVNKIALFKIDYEAVAGLEYREDISGNEEHIKSSKKLFKRLEQSYLISRSVFGCYEKA